MFEKYKDWYVVTIKTVYYVWKIRKLICCDDFWFVYLCFISAPTLVSVNFTVTSDGVQAHWVVADNCSTSYLYSIKAYSTTDPHVTTSVCGVNIMGGAHTISTSHFTECHSFTFEIIIFHSEGYPIISNRTEYSLSPSGQQGK